MTTVTPSLLPPDLDRPSGPKTGDGITSSQNGGLFEQHVREADAQARQPADAAAEPAVETSPGPQETSDAPGQELSERPKAALADLLTGTTTAQNSNEAPLPVVAAAITTGADDNGAPGADPTSPAAQDVTGDSAHLVAETGPTDGQIVALPEPTDQDAPQQPVQAADPLNAQEATEPVATTATVPVVDQQTDDTPGTNEKDQHTAQEPDQPADTGAVSVQSDQSPLIDATPDPLASAPTETDGETVPYTADDAPLEAPGELKQAEPALSQTPADRPASQPLTPAPGPLAGEAPSAPAPGSLPDTQATLVTAAAPKAQAAEQAASAKPAAAAPETPAAPPRADQPAPAQQASPTAQSPLGPARPQQQTEPAATPAAQATPAPDARTGETDAERQQRPATTAPRPAEPAAETVRAAQSPITPAVPAQPARQNAAAAAADATTGTTDGTTANTATAEPDADEPSLLKRNTDRPAEPARRNEPGLLARLSTLELAGDNPRNNPATSTRTTGLANAQTENGNQFSDAIERMTASPARPNASPTAAPTVAAPIAEAVPTGTPATAAVAVEQTTLTPLQPVSTSASTLALSPAPATPAGLQAPMAALARAHHPRVRPGCHTVPGSHGPA